jgi:hypothetical protein
VTPHEAGSRLSEATDLSAPTRPAAEQERVASSGGASPHSDTEALDAIGTLHDRTVDVLAGFDTMVGKAEPEFRPVAEAFQSLHQRHATALAGRLAEAGRAPDEGGTFMSSVNRTVVTLRSFFDEIDEDVMKQIEDGEQHVLDAFDDALKRTHGDVRDDLARMRQELVDLLAENTGRKAGQDPASH